MSGCICIVQMRLSISTDRNTQSINTASYPTMFTDSNQVRTSISVSLIYISCKKTELFSKSESIMYDVRISGYGVSFNPLGDGRLSIHHSPFTVHHSPFTIHCSPFTIHHSPFTIHHSPFTVHHSPLTTKHLLKILEQMYEILKNPKKQIYKCDRKLMI